MNIFKKYIKYLGSKIEQEIEDTVVELLPNGQDLVLLDCGCDDGEKTITRAKKIGTKKILGFENIPERVKLARKKGVKVYTCDLNQKWPLKDSSIDYITATEVIEHLIDLDNFFAESKRVLRKGGKIIISTENLAAYHNIIALLFGNQPYTGPYLSKVYPIGHRPCGKYYQKELPMNPHISVMTAKALKQLLIAYGFKLEGMSPVGFYPFPPPLFKLLAQLDKNHASYIVVKASK